MSETAIGGNIDREVATCRILVPEGQLHGCGRQVERDCLQEVGTIIDIVIRVETHTLRTVKTGTISSAIARSGGDI